MGARLHDPPIGDLVCIRDLTTQSTQPLYPYGSFRHNLSRLFDIGRQSKSANACAFSCSSPVGRQCSAPTAHVATATAAKIVPKSVRIFCYPAFLASILMVIYFRHPFS